MSTQPAARPARPSPREGLEDEVGGEAQLAPAAEVGGIDPGAIDAQQPALGGGEELLQPGLGGDDAAEPGPVGGAERVGPLDHAGELGEELAADGGVPGGGLGVAADHHPVTGVVEPDL